MPTAVWNPQVLLRSKYTKELFESSLPKNEPFTISSKSFYQNNFKFFVVHVFMVDSHK